MRLGQVDTRPGRHLESPSQSTLRGLAGFASFLELERPSHVLPRAARDMPSPTRVARVAAGRRHPPPPDIRVDLRLSQPESRPDDRLTRTPFRSRSSDPGPPAAGVPAGTGTAAAGQSRLSLGRARALAVTMTRDSELSESSCCPQA